VSKNIDKLRADSRRRAKEAYPTVAAKRAVEYQENIDERRKEARDRYHKSKARRQCSTLLNTASQRAKKRGVPFSITVDDIKIPDTCPALGFPLVIASGKVAFNSATLDRIVPELGYVPGNVIVVSMLANQIKSSATPEQIMKVAQFYANLAQ
jgi:hypothetical protein